MLHLKHSRSLARVKFIAAEPRHETVFESLVIPLIAPCTRRKIAARPVNSRQDRHKLLLFE